MEDFELIRHLKSLGKVTLVPVPVITSARRWLKKGVWQTTFINQIVIIAYFLGNLPTTNSQLVSSGKTIADTLSLDDFGVWDQRKS